MLCQNPRLMKTNKKTAIKKVSKNRLLCVTLPETLLESTQAYRKKSGFTSMSELLRAAVNKASSVAKKSTTEKKTQISFRLSDDLYTSLFRASNQSGQSIARIIRTLLESAPKLGIRPAGMPMPKKRGSVSEKPTKKPAVAASKPAAKKKPSPVAKSSEKASSKKPVPVKKTVSSKKSVSVKKSVPVKKAVPVKKTASAKKGVPAKKPASKKAVAVKKASGKRR